MFVADFLILKQRVNTVREPPILFIVNKEPDWNTPNLFFTVTRFSCNRSILNVIQSKVITSLYNGQIIKHVYTMLRKKGNCVNRVGETIPFLIGARFNRTLLRTHVLRRI